MNRRFDIRQITAAKISSRNAINRLKILKRPQVSYCLPARGHMPFDGHRTCAEVRFDARAATGVQRLKQEAQHG